MAAIIAQQKGKPGVTTTAAPVAGVSTRPPLGDRVTGVDAQRPPGPGKPVKAQAGNLADFKAVRAAGGDTRQNGKQIGFYNATHVKGEKMKGLLAKLKAQRNSGRPEGNIPAGVRPTKPRRRPTTSAYPR